MLSKKFRGYKFYLFLLFVLSCWYYSFFVLSVIPPQTGWWQYYAYCLNNGDLLYKDVYNYLPPYFTWFTRLLYVFFENNFVYYTIFGFFAIRCSAWVILYLILNRISNPCISFISVFFGVCITSTYLMDQVYDYNPAIFTFIIILIYLFIRIIEKKAINKYLFLSGIIVGCLLMTKQNIGVVLPLVCIVLFWSIFKNDNYKKKIGVFLFGAITAILPGIIYLIYTDTFYSMIDCILVATGAKVANTNIFWLLYRFSIRIKILVLILSVTLILWIEKEKKIDNKNVLHCAYIFIGILFGFITGGYIIPGLKYIPHIGLQNIVVLILTLFLISYAYITRRITLFKTLCAVFLLGVSMFAVSYTDNHVAWYVINCMNWRILLHDILYASFYINMIVWVSHSYHYYNYKTKMKDVVYWIIFMIIGSTLLVSGLSTAELEPYLGLLIVPFAMNSILQCNFISKNVSYIKNVIVVYFSVIIVFLCLITKMYMPYEWHGWCASSVLRHNPVKLIDDIPGLNGYIISYNDYNSYKVMYELIKDNSNDGDKLYQFPNIPLFNVLLQRKSYYVPIAYFDVCSDEMAIVSANELEKNMPDLFLWADLSKHRWKVHEDIFRGGKLSGQRRIREFYKEIVISEYRCLGVVDNNEGDQIELWKKR